jgi:hypothetical protein
VPEIMVTPQALQLWSKSRSKIPPSQDGNVPQRLNAKSFSVPGSPAAPSGAGVQVGAGRVQGQSVPQHTSS